MIKQYLQQSWQLIKENPVLSGITIFGTAIAITMIMVMVMVYQIDNSNMTPELNRDRTLYVSNMSSQRKSGKGTSNSCVGRGLAEKALKPVTSAEAVSMFSKPYIPVHVKQAGAKKAFNYDFMTTDAEFWHVFQFSFVAGKPYTKSDVASTLKKVVVCEKLAKDVFSKTDVVGEVCLIDYMPFTIVGVVKNVSTAMHHTYAHLWIPIGSKDNIPDENDGANGVFEVAILAKDKKDFPAIRAEVEQLRQKFEADPFPYKLNYRNQPDTHFENNFRFAANVTPNIKGEVRRYIIVLLLIILVPAINLFDLNNSQMRKRLAELGVRKAYGATRRDIVLQVLSQSLVQTLIGGALGLLLAIVSSYFLKEMLLGSIYTVMYKGDLSISLWQLVEPMTFVLAFLFCLLINLLSSLIPALKVARRNIVVSLNIKK